MTRAWGGKPDKDQLMKKPPYPDRELKKKIDGCWIKDIDKQMLMKNFLTFGEFYTENQ